MAIAQKCLFYFVQLNTNHEPIVGTMFAKPNNKIDNGDTACTEARVPPTQMVAPQGLKQCFPKSGLRYWYKVDQYGQVLPNSMFSSRTIPNKCSLNYSTLEFKIWG